MMKNGMIKTNIGKHNDNIGDITLYNPINCKNCELLLISLANVQSTYKYFSQNPVSPLISFQFERILLISKSLKLYLLWIVFNSSE